LAGRTAIPNPLTAGEFYDRPGNRTGAAKSAACENAVGTARKVAVGHLAPATKGIRSGGSGGRAVVVPPLVPGRYLRRSPLELHRGDWRADESNRRSETRERNFARRDAKPCTTPAGE